MIIAYLVTSIITLLGTVITVSVPTFDAIGDLFDYYNLIVDKGINIYRYFIPAYGQRILALIIAMNAFYFLYKFIMWFLRKIPMLGIGED